MLKEMRDLDLTIKFPKLTGTINTADVWTFSDASYNIVTGREYGQTGIVTGLHVMADGGEAFYLIDWAISNQRRKSHSPYGTKILAFSDANDRGFYHTYTPRRLAGAI